ncbi:glucose-1-phosphate adenylyltransferase subunit GlgD [Clostridium sp. P21]|uniref:Glucose-1-phosphate adenylyltransferase subunit GlgD n=1 Tax=Clostridium muellerianum TaxID=2716538 RepID=A0A7Y0HR60_9CLOT|nr:glucose-1-phosphate adenylyltransferase subunit GlgD [Clostridium muellerianum]NMM65790.1 glucose-1-phosphate adenylyltransferase subunit GlgD [Clostridium muellerianum]
MIKNSYMAVLMLNENQQDIRSLTKNRPLASIPIYGRYRIIDFILSNIVNCGIRNVSIFSPNNSRSLIDHLGTGRAWDLNRNVDGLFIFSSYPKYHYHQNENLLKNFIEYLSISKQKNVILSQSHMICNINISEVIKSHEKSKSDITVVYKNVKNADTYIHGCNIININQENKISSVQKNIGLHTEANVCMDVILMKKDLLLNFLYELAQSDIYENLYECIYVNIHKYNVNPYEFQGYVTSVNSINQYYHANMDILNPKVLHELFYNNGFIYTKPKNEPSTKYVKNSLVSNSLIANGCIIEGTVKNSIVSRQVHIAKGAIIKNSILFENCKIEKGACLNNVILDKDVLIDKNIKIQGASEFPLVVEKNSVLSSD